MGSVVLTGRMDSYGLCVNLEHQPVMLICLYIFMLFIYEWVFTSMSQSSLMSMSL